MQSGSRYFKFPLSYQHIFNTPGGLRPHLQVEFSYTQPKGSTETRAIKSFVAELSGDNAEATIACLLPIETAADKLCALTWRVIKRDRDHENDDPALIRHLHDLAALHSNILDNPDLFLNMAQTAFEIDMEMGSRTMDHDLQTAARQALEILNTDAVYANEYQQFVMNMSYANDAEALEFAAALERLEEIITLVE